MNGIRRGNIWMKVNEADMVTGYVRLYSRDSFPKEICCIWLNVFFSNIKLLNEWITLVKRITFNCDCNVNTVLIYLLVLRNTVNVINVFYIYVINSNIFAIMIIKTMKGGYHILNYLYVYKKQLYPKVLFKYS